MTIDLVLENLPDIIERLNKNFIFIKDVKKRFDLMFSDSAATDGFICYFSKYYGDILDLTYSNSKDLEFTGMDGKIPEECYCIYHDVKSNKFIVRRNEDIMKILEPALNTMFEMDIRPAWTEDEIHAVLDFIVDEINKAGLKIE